jgi:hypothetical protein
MHPLLLSSSLPISVSSLVGGHASSDSTTRAPVASEVQAQPTTSSLHHAIEVQQAAPAAPTPEKFKPWPYSHPKPLQLKVGTTFDLMYGDDVGVGDGQVAKGKLGGLQKVFCGMPEPRKKDGDDEN